MQIDNLKYEKKLYKEGYELIAGCDEAGRGPLCGPVVCAAVVLPKNYYCKGLTDSKKLSAKQRDIFYDIIQKDAISIGVSIIDAKTIDEINILEASRKGMIEAVESLNVKPDFILTDAMDLHKSNVLSLIKGDQKSITISAASIIAKVTRDRIMDKYDEKYPEYEFKKHKGYPTKRHLEIISEKGILPFYRMTFNPVKKVVERGKNENSKK